MKRIGAFFLAAALTLALTLPALAADQTVTGTGDITLTGNVSNNPADLISVTMPVSIDFTVSTDNDTYFSAITHVQGEVSNNSALPVKMEITKVDDPSNLLTMLDLALAPVSVVGTSQGTQWTWNDGNAFTHPGKYWLNKVTSTAPMVLFDSLAGSGGHDSITTCAQALTPTTAIASGSYTLKTTITVSLIR